MMEIDRILKEAAVYPVRCDCGWFGISDSCHYLRCPNCGRELEPTADEISRAWTIALESADIPGARAESLYFLQKLRERKTTWVGKYENDLMFSIDNYLRDGRNQQTD